MFSQEKVSFLNQDNGEITFKISDEYYLVNYKTLIDENIIKSNVKEFTVVTEGKALISIEKNN